MALHLTLFTEMLGSCRCSLACVLYFLVTVLGIVVFAVLSKYIWFWEEKNQSGEGVEAQD